MRGKQVFLCRIRMMLLLESEERVRLQRWSRSVRMWPGSSSHSRAELTAASNASSSASECNRFRANRRALFAFRPSRTSRERLMSRWRQGNKQPAVYLQFLAEGVDAQKKKKKSVFSHVLHGLTSESSQRNNIICCLAINHVQIKGILSIHH